MIEMYVENDFKLLYDEYGAKVVLQQFDHKDNIWKPIEEEFCMNLAAKLIARAELEDRLLKETNDTKIT